VSTVSSVPRFLSAFVDDAAIFPPGNLPLKEAVAAHREHHASKYARLVGPFVISDVRIPDLLEELKDSSEPFPVTVVVTGGAGAIEPAVRWATKSGLLDVGSLETPLRNEDDLARNAMRVVAAVDQVREHLGGVPVYVEPPRTFGDPTHGWLAALDEIASAGLRLKFRTGGVEADAFPTAAELATSIDAALDRELAFKCTAGLHHAVRNGHQHGFLNILGATALAFEGAGTDAVVAELENTAPKIQTDGFVSARRWFTSFGCCSVIEPLQDLVELGLVTL
jgi:hypothetical protein